MRCGDRPFFSIFATGMCPVIGAIAIFKRVPAEICENCGEYYLSDAVTGENLGQAWIDDGQNEAT